MIRWSRSKVKSQSAREQLSFEEVTGTFADLTCSLFEQPWSPCVWRSGRRAQANFISAEVVALDFDSGVSILDVCQTCVDRGLEFAVATTKSHRREKSKDGVITAPACDRFRLIMPAARIITDAGEYQWVMQTAMSEFPGCDRACRDAARFFFPSVKLSCFADGKPYSWPQRPAPVAVEAAKIIIPPGRVASTVMHRLFYGTEDGTRHKYLVKDSFHLGAQGIAEVEAREMVVNSGYTLPVEEKIRIFNSQWRKGWNLFQALNKSI